MKKNKKNKKVTFYKISKCYLITNLNSNEYNDKKVKKIYLNRWSVESFLNYLSLTIDLLIKLTILIQILKHNTINKIILYLFNIILLELLI